MVEFKMWKWQRTTIFIFGFMFAFVFGWLNLAWKGMYDGPIAMDMMIPVVLGVCLAYATKTIRGSGWLLVGAMVGMMANKLYLVGLTMKPIALYNIVLVAGGMIGFWIQTGVDEQNNWKNIALTGFLAILWGLFFWLSPIYPHIEVVKLDASGLVSTSFWPLITGVIITIANKGNKNLTPIYIALFIITQMVVVTAKLGWSNNVWESAIIQLVLCIIGWYGQKRFNFLSLG